jgi:hypothetical protein
MKMTDKTKQSDRTEELIQQMKDLTDVVKDHRTDPATMDFERVKETFEAQIGALVDEQVKEQLISAPMRHGDPVPANGNNGALVPVTNRYASAVRDISRDGFSRNWSATPMKAVDLWMARTMLDAQVALQELVTSWFPRVCLQTCGRTSSWRPGSWQVLTVSRCQPTRLRFRWAWGM